MVLMRESPQLPHRRAIRIAAEREIPFLQADLPVLLLGIMLILVVEVETRHEKEKSCSKLLRLFSRLL